jgi:hypothetical protein
MNLLMNEAGGDSAYFRNGFTRFSYPSRNKTEMVRRPGYVSRHSVSPRVRLGSGRPSRVHGGGGLSVCVFCL